MTTQDVLSLFVDLQFLETLFLLVMLWAFYARLTRRQLYWWWMWAWVGFAVYLGAGRFSLAVGPDWSVLKGSLILLATCGGFVQATALWLGVETLPAGQENSRQPWKAAIGLAAALGAIAFAAAFLLRSDPVLSFTARTLPRQLLLAAAFFYCASVFLRGLPRRSLAVWVTGISCALYGLNQAVYAVASAQPLVSRLGHDSEGLALLASQLTPRFFLMDMVWEAGIAVGMVLLLTEEHAESAKALRLSESRYRALVESSQGLICTHDLDGNFLSVNPAAAHLLGYEPEEMTGKHVTDFLAPWSLERVDEYMGYLKQDRVDSGLLRAKARDGRELVWVYQSALFEEPGQKPVVLGHAQDITDRIRAEEALRESEAKQRALLHAMPDMMLVIERDGTLADFKASREFEPTMPAEKFLGKKITETLPRELAQLTLGYIEQALESREVVVYEYRLPSPDGREFFEARLVAAGEDKVIAIVRDITARKRAEDGLLRSEAALEEAQRIAAVGSWDWDLVYDNLVCSKEFYRLFGLPEREVGILDEFMKVVHPEDRPRVESAISESLELGSSTDIEYRLILPDRSIRQIRAKGEVLCDAEGKPLRMIGTVMDVTQIREVEKMKDEFVSVVSHEVRTPLTSIRGSLGLLASGKLGDLSPKGRRMLEVAVTNTDRLVRLLNDILDLERMKTGKLEILRTDWVAGEVIREACEIMQPNADRAGVKLEWGGSETVLEADRDRIVQVLTNLLSNAIKFSPAGETVWVRAAENGSEIIFEVEDRGRGVPTSKAEKIFERFQQVDRSDARQKGGAGLGLAICRSIVEEHGGRIWVESGSGKGSTFNFSLPYTAELQDA